MPVFDFNETTDNKNSSEYTYTTFQSSESAASPEKPILFWTTRRRKWRTCNPAECLQIRSSAPPLNFMKKTARSVPIF